MSFPSVPYTFANGVGNIIDATAINANFTALVNAFSDSASDLSMRDGTFAGTLSVTGDGAISGNIQVDGTMAVGTSSPTARLHVVGDALITGDLTDGTGWVDHSSDSTVVGWSTDETCNIYTKHIGARYYVGFALGGTSDSTGIEFTLPATSIADVTFNGPVQVVDGASPTAQAAPGMWEILPSSNILKCYKTWADGTWADTSSKSVWGWAMYEGTA